LRPRRPLKWACPKDLLRRPVSWPYDITAALHRAAPFHELSLPSLATAQAVEAPNSARPNARFAYEFISALRLGRRPGPGSAFSTSASAFTRLRHAGNPFTAPDVSRGIARHQRPPGPSTSTSVRSGSRLASCVMPHPPARRLRPVRAPHGPGHRGLDASHREKRLLLASDRPLRSRAPQRLAAAHDALCRPRATPASTGSADARAPSPSEGPDDQSSRLMDRPTRRTVIRRRLRRSTNPWMAVPPKVDVGWRAARDSTTRRAQLTRPVDYGRITPAMGPAQAGRHGYVANAQELS